MSRPSRLGKHSTTRRARRQELDIAHGIGGRRQPGSGNQWHSKGDIRVGDLCLIEAKQTEAPYINIHKTVVEKIRVESIAQGQEYWAVAADLVRSHRRIYLVSPCMVETAWDLGIDIPSENGHRSLGSRKSISLKAVDAAFTYVETMWSTNFYIVTKDMFRIMIQGLREPEPFLDVSRILYHYGTDMNHAPSSRAVGVVGGSDLGRCKRKSWYRMIGEFPVTGFESNTRFIFQIGHAVHERLQSMLHDIFGDLFQEEVLAEIPEYRFSGSIDGVIDGTDIPSDAEPEDYIDFKDWYSDDLSTCIKHLFYSVRGERKLMLELKSCSKSQTSPDPIHLRQATAYSIAAGCTHIHFIYINKTNGNLTQFTLPVNPKSSTYVSVVKELTYLKEKFDALEAPPREPNARTCGSCGYRHTCKPGN